MAELALKISDSNDYKDGDIIAAFSRRRIRCTHAQHICHVKNAGGGVRAPRDSSHVAKDFLEHTHQYRFERVSRTEVKRVTLATLDEVILDGTPKMIDGQMQHMAVQEFIERRLRHDRHAIFGTSALAVWYGGEKTFNHAKLDLVWNAIETKTVNREVDFDLWPVGAQDLKSHLFLPCDDFDESTEQELVESEIDETDPDNPVVVKKRRRKVIWQNLFPVNIPPITNAADVTDRVKTVDVRRRSAGAFNRATIVELKA